MPKADTSNVSHIEQVQPVEGAEIIKLGVEAEQFMSSGVGRYILGKAMREAVEATADIRSLNSSAKDFKEKYDTKQAVINRHLDLERWIKEAINIGNQAYAQYEDNFNGSDD